MNKEKTYQDIIQRLSIFNEEDFEQKTEVDVNLVLEKIWRSLIMNAPYGIIILNQEGNILFLNDVSSGTFRTQNFNPEKMLGENIYQFMNQEDQKRVRKAIEKAFLLGEFSSYESRGFEPGPHFWYRGRIGPIKWQDKIVAISLIAKDITKQKQAEDALLKAHDDLEKRVEERTQELWRVNRQLRHEIDEREKVEEALFIKSKNLEDVNTALRVLLKKRDEDQKELEEKVLKNMKELAFPYLDKLKTMGLNERQMAYANILETSLNDIVSPFTRYLSTFSNLSPTETQVANLIKQGKTSKEMAEMMSLSVRTLEGYRDKIRKKLNIKNKKVNLATYLKSLELSKDMAKIPGYSRDR